MPPWGETPAEQEGAGGVFPQPSLPPQTEEKPRGAGPAWGRCHPPSVCQPDFRDPDPSRSRGWALT